MFCRAKIYAKPFRELINPFLTATNEFLSQQTRNTFILKRRIPPKLHKRGATHPHPLRPRNYIYDLVVNTNIQKHRVDLILTSDTPYFGFMGDRISVPIIKAYNKLILPEKAVYATPENIEKYKELMKRQVSDGQESSSKFVRQTMRILSTICLPVMMSKSNPWTVEPWHIKTSFRMAGYHVPDEAIKLPEEPISGPDLDKEKKDFYVTVTINSIFSVNVRCRLFHLYLNDSEDNDSYFSTEIDPIFEADRALLESLPKCEPPKQRTTEN